MKYWKIEDVNNGLCTVAEVGAPRPEAEPAPVAPMAVEASPLALRDLLRHDARQAYIESGGVEYLKRNPDLLDKILAKAVVPETASPTVNIRLDEMPWLTAQRHAYQLGADAVKLIESGLAITDANPKAAEPDHDAPALPEAGRSGFPGA